MIDVRCSCGFTFAAEDCSRLLLERLKVPEVKQALDDLYGSTAGRAGLEMFGGRSEAALTGTSWGKAYDHLREMAETGREAHALTVTWCELPEVE